tara:strand:- start:146 stop:364 length:219 start_codon:yes stop_codon:yes gene_type:complete
MKELDMENKNDYGAKKPVVEKKKVETDSKKDDKTSKKIEKSVKKDQKQKVAKSEEKGEDFSKTSDKEPKKSP